MPGLTPKLLELEKAEKEELEKILARHNTSQQFAKRARIIILASSAQSTNYFLKESASNCYRTRVIKSSLFR